MESFVARVFDIARPFNSILGTGFAIENRWASLRGSQFGVPGIRWDTPQSAFRPWDAN